MLAFNFRRYLQILRFVQGLNKSKNFFVELVLHFYDTSYSYSNDLKKLKDLKYSIEKPSLYYISKRSIEINARITEVKIEIDATCTV